MRTHWLVMEGVGPAAPYRTRLAGAGRHLPATASETPTPDVDHASPHPHRPRAADRHPRASSLGRRRGLLQPCHLGGAGLPRAGRTGCRRARRGHQLQHHEVSRRPDPVAGADDEPRRRPCDRRRERDDLRRLQRVRRNADRRHGAQQLDPAGNGRARAGGQRRVHLPARPERGPAHPQHHEQGTRLPDPRRRGGGASARTCPCGLARVSALPASPPSPTTADCAWPIRRAAIPGARMFTDSRASNAQRSPTPRCCCTRFSKPQASRCTTSIT